jgi:glycosyltransferase involved in cell wall biosynthesis
MTDMTDNKIKVLHAPHDIGGNAYYLARGERALGLDSANLVYTKQWYGYQSDLCLNLRQDSNPTHSLRWWFAFIKIALTYDVIHFNFGASFLTYFPKRWVYADLPLWKSLGIPVFVTFQGCESRLSNYVMDNFEIKVCENCGSYKDLCVPAYDYFKMEVIAQAGRFFDGIFVLNPDLLHNIPKGEFLPYANCDIEEWKPPVDYDWHHSGPVRILHAPSNPRVKGTDAVKEAIAQLQEEGENVELILVQNMPHNKVRALYESADLLVDQLLCGWYGGLAVELMALGKPVIAYIREGDLKFIPEEMKKDLPVISADAVTLKDELRKLIREPDLRKQLGQKSRLFVEKWHDPCLVAKTTTEAYIEALTKHPRIEGERNRLRVIVKKAKPLVGYLLSYFRANWFPFVILRMIWKR